MLTDPLAFWTTLRSSTGARLTLSEAQRALLEAVAEGRPCLALLKSRGRHWPAAPGKPDPHFAHGGRILIETSKSPE